MILQGNQRGYARELALHLLKDENDHVEIHELRGFVSNDLESALNETHAIARGTRAKKYLFSLSLNPPPEANVSTEAFQTAIDRVEKKLGLDGQSRAIVFHTKSERRHAHCVWSRIDTEAMKAIPLSHTKLKLMELSRELYREHGWKMPQGMISKEKRSRDNFTLAEWQQAKRLGIDRKAMKRAIQGCWDASQIQDEFASQLRDQGYMLARGDRRGVVLLDQRCEVFALGRWVGLKAKQVREKIPDQYKLPSVEQARQQIANEMINRLDSLKAQQRKAIDARRQYLTDKRLALKKEHQRKRDEQKQAQELREISEVKVRQERYRKGLLGLLDRVTGKHNAIRKQNELEFQQALLRDQRDSDALYFQQMAEKKSLAGRIDRLKQFREYSLEKVAEDKNQFRDIRNGKRDVFEFRKSNRAQRIYRGPIQER